MKDVFKDFFQPASPPQSLDQSQTASVKHDQFNGRNHPIRFKSNSVKLSDRNEANKINLGSVSKSFRQKNGWNCLSTGRRTGGIEARNEVQPGVFVCAHFVRQWIFSWRLLKLSQGLRRSSFRLSLFLFLSVSVNLGLETWCLHFSFNAFK